MIYICFDGTQCIFHKARPGQCQVHYESNPKAFSSKQALYRMIMIYIYIYALVKCNVFCIKRDRVNTKNITKSAKRMN